MKPVKNLVFAALLVFTLAFNTFAGDIQHPGIAAPTPTPSPEAVIDATDETIPDACRQARVVVTFEVDFLDWPILDH